MEHKTLEKGLEVANKAVDLANKIYDDGLSKPVKNFGNGLSMCLSFLGSTISPIMYEYIQNAEYKKQEIDRKLSSKYNSIPKEKRVNPRMNVLGPAVELLKYNLDEEYIKEIFINLINNEMNSDNQSRVLPSYVDAIKQLNKEDAMMLKKLYNICNTNGANILALLVIRANTDSTCSYFELDKYIIDCAYVKNNRTHCHSIMLNPIVIDNLCRLGFIKLYDDRFISEKEIYEIGFNALKNNYNGANGMKIDYTKGIFEITKYGRNFIEICFN